MKIALIQLSAGNDKAANLSRAVFLIKKAADKKAEFILLPEVFIFRGDVCVNPAVVEKIPGETSRALASTAKQFGVYLLAGSIYEKSAGSKKAYNTSLLFGPEGKTLAKYQKINLFNARLGNKSICEADSFLRGTKTVMTKVKEFKVGLSVCFDLRFPEMYREYFKQNADVLTIPSAFTKITGQAHWEVLLRARAIENQCYVLAPNQIGQDHRGVETYGNSMVVDPWGKILARASGNKEEILYADIDLKENSRARKTLSLKKITV